MGVGSTWQLAKRGGDFQMTPTPFEAAIESAGDAVTGYIATAFPVVAAVVVAGLGIKWFRRLGNRI
jgi:hypothetical protein